MIVTPRNDGVGLKAGVQSCKLERFRAASGHAGVTHVEKLTLSSHLLSDPGTVLLPYSTDLLLGFVSKLTGEFTVRRPDQHHIITTLGMFAQRAYAAKFIIRMGENREEPHGSLC